MISKTKITIEARHRTTIRRTSAMKIAWCERCAAETAMFSPEEFACLSGTSPREVYHAIEDGKLHFTETIGGALFVCDTSLKNQIEGEHL